MTSSREEFEEEFGEEFEEEFEEEPLPPSPRRNTRGINTKLKEDAPREIEFNEFSLRVGKTYPTFSSQVGISTRNHVNIKYKDWRSVPREDKDRLWHEIRRDYNLPDDPKKKKKLMQQCSLAFKRFKTRLRNNFMDLGKDPCSVYKFIEKSDWEAFLAIEATDERKLEREKGQQNALKKKIQTHLGRMGYRGREDAWAKEAEKGGLVGEIHKLFDPRARRFFLARVVKDKKGGYLPIPLSSDFDKLVQLEGELEAGHLSLPTGKDLLWYVIGPEHGGRTRGVGCTVGIREGIQNYKETRNRMPRAQIRDETIASSTESVQNVEGVVAVTSRCQTNTPEGASGASDSAIMRSCGSPMFSSNDTQERKKCFLLLPHVINRDVNCARGVLCIGPGSEMLHGSPILDGYAKVQLDHVELGYESFDLPVPSDEHFKLEDAIGTFIQWPKSAISIFKLSSQPSPTPDQRDAGPSSSKNFTSRLPANKTCGDASETCEAEVKQETCESEDGNPMQKRKRGRSPILQAKRPNGLQKGNSCSRPPEPSGALNNAIMNTEYQQVWPFMKQSAIWANIESLESCRQPPQKPHFSPLKKVRADYREGLAISHMVTFDNLFQNISKMQLTDPVDIIKDNLETLVNLETHGFDVGAVRARLNELLSWKDKVGQLRDMAKKDEEEFEKCKEEMNQLEVRIKKLQTKMEQNAKQIIDCELAFKNHAAAPL